VIKSLSPCTSEPDSDSPTSLGNNIATSEGHISHLSIALTCSRTAIKVQFETQSDEPKATCYGTFVGQAHDVPGDEISFHMFRTRGIVQTIAPLLVATAIGGPLNPAIAQNFEPPPGFHESNLRGTNIRLPALRESANIDQYTVGVALANEPQLLEAVLALDEEVAHHGGFRLVPIVAQSAAQSLYDLLFLRGVDAAVIRSDVIEFIASQGGYPGARNVINTLARLRQDKLVLVSSKSIKSLGELNGKTISLGERASSEHLTGALLLASAGIKAQHRYLPADEALEQLDAGKIDAFLPPQDPKNSPFRPLNNCQRLYTFCPLNSVQILQKSTSQRV